MFPHFLKEQDMCDDFARTRLKICPRDVQQRIADGLGSVLSILGNACGTFQFETLINAADPTSALPVLFSSHQYTCPELVPLSPTKGPNAECVEYWYGLEPMFSPRLVMNTLCARCGDMSYWFDADKRSWYGAGINLFKSVPGACLIVQNPGETLPKFISIHQDDGTYTALGSMSVVTACQLSGDGQVFFVRDAVGWKRHQNAQTWIPVGKPDPDSELHTSFAGQTFLQSNPRSPDYYYNIGSAGLKSKRLPADDSQDRPVWSAVLDNTIFIARGKKLYSVGSLDVEQVVYELSAGDTVRGLWADAQTLWLSTEKGTFMTSNGAWTWTELNNALAVGPGLFTKPNDGQIWTHSSQPFVEAVGYPLRLNNGGLLYSDVNHWANAYQDKTKDDKYTTVEATDAAALSPNGQYLLTQEDGVVTLYLNVWNSAKFSAWCKAGGDCQAAYARYCQQFKGDPGCKTGGPNEPDAGGPDSKSFPTLATILIVVAGLGLIGALLYWWLRKRESKPVLLITP
jgi:hypothetical protein